MPTSHECRIKAALYLQQADETDHPHFRSLLRRLAVDVLSIANQMDGAHSLQEHRPLQHHVRSIVDRPAAVV